MRRRRHQNSRKKRRKRRPIRRGTWDLESHEIAAYLAFGLLCGSNSSDVKVRLASPFEDVALGTDMVLHHRRHRLYIDVTTGDHVTVMGKIGRNKEKKGKAKEKGFRSRDVWIVSQELTGFSISSKATGCLFMAWDRLRTLEPTSFSPADFDCSLHGANCPLVKDLQKLGKEIVKKLWKKPRWHALFQR